MVCIKEPEKTKAAQASGGSFLLETSLRNIFVPRIERLLAQGTVASPARLPGSGLSEPLLMLVSIITAMVSCVFRGLNLAIRFMGHWRGLRLQGEEFACSVWLATVTIRGTLEEDANARL